MNRRPTHAAGAAAALLLAVMLLVGGCGARPQPFENGTAKQAGDAEIALSLEPNPPRAGKDVELTFTVKRAGEPVPPEELPVEAVVDMPKMPMNLPAVKLQADGPGRLRARYRFPMAGGWMVDLRLRQRSGDLATVRFQFDVAP